MTPIKRILFAGAAAVLTAGAASAQAQNYESAPTFGPHISAGYNYLDFDEKIGSDAYAESLGIHLQLNFGG